MRELTKEQKILIAHYYKSGLTQLEIAQRMALKLGDVRSVTASIPRPARKVSAGSFAPSKWVQNILTTCIRRDMSEMDIQSAFAKEGHKVTLQWVRKAVKHSKGEVS